MRYGYAALLVLLAASGVQAQAADSYVLRFYNIGATAPLVTNDAFPSTSVACNQPPPTATSTINPTRVVWDDPAIPGRVCIFLPSTSAGLFALPIPGDYEATLTFTDGTTSLSSPESARAPFTRRSLPPVRTGFKLVR